MSDFSLGPEGGIARFDSFHGRTEGGTNQGGLRYPSPFFDIGHTYLPTSIKQMLRWCRYYFLTNPLVNSVIYKKAEYPVTEIVVEEEDSETRARWENIIENQLKLRKFDIEVGLDYGCFHGDVKAVTRDGVFKLRDLVGKTVDVLSQDGTYRPATFKSFGRQELLEVEFSDGSTVLATREHEWPVITQHDKTIKMQTTDLPCGDRNYRLIRNVAPHPEKNEEFYSGVRHGFVFGDGTLYNEGKQARAYFYGAKDAEMLNYFAGVGSPPCKANDGAIQIHGLPSTWKTLPETGASASYWYGFICGFLAADGSVDVAGCVVLTQKARTTLDVIAEQLPRIGMAAGKIRGYFRSSEYGEGAMHYLSLLKQYMEPEDLLLSSHRRKFEENFKPTNNRKYAHVVAVRDTGLVDEVFCCVEMETHTFTLGNGILTGNCYGNAFVSIHFPFHKYLVCTNCKHKVKIQESAYKFRNFQYYLSCGKCDTTGPAKVIDWKIKDLRGIKLIRWNPEYITAEHNECTGESTYFFELPMQLRADIMMGKRHIVETIPHVFVESLRETKSICFTKDNFYSLKRPTIAEKDQGWGLPAILPVLKDTYYLQILRKAQEAIAQQHIVPLRILFPQAGSAAADPYSTTNLGTWRKRIEGEITKWRTDPNYIPILPLPIGNETIGGEGKSLMLHQEMRAWSEQIVAGMHVPIEFVFGGLSYSGTNISMRMLENHFLGYRTELQIMNRDFILGKIADFLGVPRPNVKFKRFRMADDLQRLSLVFQMNQAMKLSDTTLLDEADFDFVQEEKYKRSEIAKQLENQRRMQLAQANLQGEVQVVTAKYQAKAQQMMMASQGGATGGAPAPGGAPPAGGGGAEAPAGGALPGQEDQQPDVGAQAAPGMPAGATAYPEQGGEMPQEGLPGSVQSPLNQQQQQGGYNILYLARRAATELQKMDDATRYVELMKMQGTNPQLYTLVLQLLTSDQGGQVDQTDPLQSPLPEQKPPRRQVSFQ